MKKAIVTIFLFLFMSLIITGCVKKEESSDKTVLTIDHKISMSIKENTLTNKSTTIRLKNNSEEEFTYGPEYHLEKQNDGKWDDIEPKEVLSWNSVLYRLKSNEFIEINIDWTTGYGELSKGHHRLVKNVHLKSDQPEEDSNRISVSVEFEME